MILQFSLSRKKRFQKQMGRVRMPHNQHTYGTIYNNKS
uniref:Uncharacterized protein n=1 Tax=Lepeophtheirus salmonis TaxID=72036 RepID=A0A0K2VIN8_LEPSM